MKKSNFSKLDFDSMTAIAQDDPDEFERLRQQAIDEFIESTPPEHQVRLRRLQWRIDQVRKNHSPLSACIRISKMMMDHLLGPHGLLTYQQRLLNPEHPLTVDSAKVLRFPTNHN
jgi:hypothetical protein